MKQKWKETQAVEITIDEIFCLQDKIDMVKDDPIKVWEVFDDFLAICESQLEISPTFLKQLHEVDIEKDFVPLSIDELDELLNDCDFDAEYNVAEDYVNYVLAQQKQKEEKKYDIPFRPRINF